MANGVNSRPNPEIFRPSRPSLAPEGVVHIAEILLLGIGFLLLADRFFRLISNYAVNIFFYDQWDFNDATLFEHHTLWQMFRWQHGPHRQGVGALLQWLVEPLFRWNSRTESFLVGGIVVAAALCALGLKRKLYGRFSYSDLVIAIVFLSPLQYQTLFVTANFAHGPLPLFLVLLYCLAWTCRGVLFRYALVLTINFVTIYTGFGIFLGLLTPLLLAIDYWVNLRDTPRGLSYLLGGLLLSLASLTSFFVGYRIQTAASCPVSHLQSPVNYAWFVSLMFAPFLSIRGIGALPTAAGALLVCALLASLALAVRNVLRRQSAQAPRHMAITILTAYCLLFCVGTAYGRLCMGVWNAQESRYAIYLDLGLLGIYFCLLTTSNVVARNVLAVVFALSLLGSAQPSQYMLYTMATEHNVKQAWKNCYLRFGDIKECNLYSRIYPWESERTHLQEKLDFLRENRQNLFTDSK